MTWCVCNMDVKNFLILWNKFSCTQVRQFFRPSSAGSTRLPRHRLPHPPCSLSFMLKQLCRFARDLDPADVAVKHEAKTKASEPSSSSRPSSALDRSKTQTPPSLDNPSISAAGASVGDAAVSEVTITWNFIAETFHVKQIILDYYGSNQLGHDGRDHSCRNYGRHQQQ